MGVTKREWTLRRELDNLQGAFGEARCLECDWPLDISAHMDEDGTMWLQLWCSQCERSISTSMRDVTEKETEQ